jgi:hypothetical protein
MNLKRILRHCRSRFREYIARAPSIVLFWAVLRSCSFKSIKGICIGDSSGTVSNGFSELLRDALDLVEQHDPVRWYRIRRQIRFIVKAPGVAPITYQECLRACFVDLKFFGRCSRKTTVATLAALLIESATYGHLIRHEIVCTRRHQKRFGELCSRQVLHFLHRRLGMAPLPWEKDIGNNPSAEGELRIVLKELGTIWGGDRE